MTKVSEDAVEALAVFLLTRDWPGTDWVNPNWDARSQRRRRYEYQRRAAAILAGEAWAIRHTWPEAVTPAPAPDHASGDETGEA